MKNLIVNGKGAESIAAKSLRMDMCALFAIEQGIK